MSDNTWNKINERRKCKEQLLNATTRQQTRQAQELYNNKDKEVKKGCRDDKRKHVEQLADDAETACSKGDIEPLYNITRQLSGKTSNSDTPVKDKNGNIITKPEDQLKRWREHFQEVLNRPPPTDSPSLEIGQPLNIRTGNITRAEVTTAIKHLKSGKASGVDNIPPEAMKALDAMSIDKLHQLLNRIWEEEQIPQDWSKGILVKLPKKGDKSVCGNWRGITLLSIPSKVLCHIILHRIKKEVDTILRDEQAGFRQERSCADQIATLRIIIEQTIEWQSSLYLTFIDFEKAFDSIDHKALWNILEHYGIPEKIMSIIRQLYDGFTCQVIHGGSLTDPFPVTTGVRQGCLLSPLLFLIVIDWVSRTAYSTPSGIRWTLQSCLEDLAFADDICQLSHRHRDFTRTSNQLRINCKESGVLHKSDKDQVHEDKRKL